MQDTCRAVANLSSMPTLTDVVDLLHAWYPPDTAEEFLREADRDMAERKARGREQRETA